MNVPQGDDCLIPRSGALFSKKLVSKTHNEAEGNDHKQLLDVVSVISRIIKVEVGVISPS